MTTRTVGGNSLKRDAACQPIFIRPQTANLHSIKRITEILEGKYISMQARPPTLVPKGSEERKRQLLSQAQSRVNKRRRNPSIENCKTAK